MEKKKKSFLCPQKDNKNDVLWVTLPVLGLNIPYPTFKYQPMKQEKRICIKVLFRYLQSTTKTTLSLPNTQTDTLIMLISHILSTIRDDDFLFGFAIFWSLSLRKQYRYKVIKKQHKKVILIF